DFIEAATKYRITYDTWQRQDVDAPRDDGKAAQKILLSAQLGFGPAQAAIAKIYFNGNGVQKNLAETYFWASVAINNSLCLFDKDSAKTLRDEAAKALTDQQVAELDKKLVSWVPTKGHETYAHTPVISNWSRDFRNISRAAKSGSPGAEEALAGFFMQKR